MMQVIPEPHCVELREFRKMLNAKCRELYVSDATMEQQFSELEKVAKEWECDELPPEISICYRRELVDAKYRCAVDRTTDPTFLTMVKDEFDRIGYNYPILWGAIRCDLADLYEQAGEISSARKLRKDVAAEFEKLIHFARTAVLSRTSMD